MSNYNDDYIEICRILESKHSIFYKFWQIGTPRFTNKIPTAAVAFDRVGEFVDFIFNEKFWEGLDNYNRAFIISHESLHVILGHGVRGKGLYPEIANIAMDVVINETLVRKFGFERDKINNWKEYCWLDTAFLDKEAKPRTDILPFQNFEYYYNKLMENVTIIQVSMSQGGLKTVDDHSGLGEIVSKQKEVFEKVAEACSDKEKLNTPEFTKQEQDKKSEEVYKKAGLHPGENAKTIKANYCPKKKWETVIKTWVIANSDKDDELWNKRHRRMSGLSKKLILPVDNEDDIKKEKIRLWFFQDTSGSCVDLAERFFKAARTIPKSHFDISMFCFDTKVYKTDLESGKLYGFGGTSFTCISEFINKAEGQSIKMPHAIFVITDGYGDNVSPKYPNRWHWFLSTDEKGCIHKDCIIHKLSDFE